MKNTESSVHAQQRISQIQSQIQKECGGLSSVMSYLGTGTMQAETNRRYTRVVTCVMLGVILGAIIFSQHWFLGILTAGAGIAIGYIMRFSDADKRVLTLAIKKMDRELNQNSFQGKAFEIQGEPDNER